MQVATILMRNGFQVAKNCNPLASNDLIIFKNNRFAFLEVRSGYINPNTGKAIFPRKVTDEAKIYAVY
jgi:hypothetical protein